MPPVGFLGGVPAERLDVVVLPVLPEPLFGTDAPAVPGRAGPGRWAGPRRCTGTSGAAGRSCRRHRRAGSSAGIASTGITGTAIASAAVARTATRGVFVTVVVRSPLLGSLCQAADGEAGRGGSAQKDSRVASCVVGYLMRQSLDILAVQVLRRVADIMGRISHQPCEPILLPAQFLRRRIECRRDMIQTTRGMLPGPLCRVSCLAAYGLSNASARVPRVIGDIARRFPRALA